jgi:hypothetical protein
MINVKIVPASRGYRLIAHQFQYSGRVAAEPGFYIARFTRPVPLAEGLGDRSLPWRHRTLADRVLRLRAGSSAQFTDAGFVAFNRHYVERLAAWRIFRDEVNPVACSNVCPEIDAPAMPSLYAFSYTVPSENRSARSFVAAGSGEAREGGANCEGCISTRRPIAGGDARESALRALGFGKPSNFLDRSTSNIFYLYGSPLLAGFRCRSGRFSANPAEPLDTPRVSLHGDTMANFGMIKRPAAKPEVRKAALLRHGRGRSALRCLLGGYLFCSGSIMFAAVDKRIPQYYVKYARVKSAVILYIDNTYSPN